MADPSENYSVVLRSGMPPAERELMEQFCCRITLASGEPPLLHVLCTSVDVSHPIYLFVEAFKPGDTSTHPLRIQHQYVLLISGDESRPPIGFLSGATSHDTRT